MSHFGLGFLTPSSVGGNDAFTKLLIHGDGSIGDSSPVGRAITVSGTTAADATQSVFGGGSVKFPGGSSGWLQFDSGTTDFYFGTGDFTIDMRLRFASLPGTNTHVYDGRPFSTNGAFPTIYINAAASNAIRYYANSADRILGPSLSINTWYHIAVARSGTSTKMFVDGSQVGSTYSDTTNYSGDVNRPVIGASMTGQDGVNAWMDEIRVSKGIARWTANFTPPTGPYG